MPDLTGIEELRELKQIDPHIECVMLTGCETLETARAAMRHGAIDYLNKPFDVFFIRGLVDRCINQRQQKKAVERDLQALREMNTELAHELARAKRAVTATVLAAGLCMRSTARFRSSPVTRNCSASRWRSLNPFSNRAAERFNST